MGCMYTPASRWAGVEDKPLMPCMRWRLWCTLCCVSRLACSAIAFRFRRVCVAITNSWCVFVVGARCGSQPPGHRLAHDTGVTISLPWTHAFSRCGWWSLWQTWSPQKKSSLLQAVFFRRDDSDCYWTSDCASAWDWCDLRAFAINRSWRDFTINWSCVTGETSLSTGTGNQFNLVVPSARERSPKLRRQAWLLLAYQLSGADDLRSLLLELVDGNPRVTND